MTEIKKIATRDAYGKALAELAKENSNIFVMDADLSQSTKSVEFAKVCPERFVNAGIAGQYDRCCSRIGGNGQDRLCQQLCCFCHRTCF